MSTEITRIDKILEKIPQDKQTEADILASELRFIATQMDSLKKDISVNGCVDHFKQGKQEFLRESPYLTAYNKLAKTYDTYLTRIMALLPKEIVMTDDEIDKEFF